MSSENLSQRPTLPQGPDKLADPSAGDIADSLLAPSERPPIATAPISAIFPVFNDDANLAKTLPEWVKALNELNRDYEILLIDEASTDRTPILAGEASEGQVRLIRHEARRGLGAALRTGLEAARFPLILISTCDGRFQPTNLQHFLKWIDQVDMVCGFRNRQAGEYRPTWASWVYRWLVRAVFALRLQDPECLYLLARKAIFPRIPIQTAGPFGFTEMLAKANFLGCLMHEARVTYHANAEAESKWTAVSLRDKLAGFRRVFSKPDFGPASLPAQPLTSSNLK
jgi:glycosyltransferase involved in cell wall biosynthesis